MIVCTVVDLHGLVRLNTNEIPCCIAVASCGSKGFSFQVIPFVLHVHVLDRAAILICCCICICMGDHSWGNDHRWTAIFHPSLCLSSMSRSFKFDDKKNWVAKLKEVHIYAWKTWKSHLSHKKEFSLAPSRIQEPGELPEDVLEEVAGEVAGLPPKTQYHRMKWGEKEKQQQQHHQESSVHV